MSAPDLAEIFDAIDNRSLTTHILIVRADNGWQVSMKRPKGGAFAVAVKPSLVEAIVGCLGVEADVKDDDWERLI